MDRPEAREEGAGGDVIELFRGDTPPEHYWEVAMKLVRLSGEDLLGGDTGNLRRTVFMYLAQRWDELVAKKVRRKRSHLAHPASAYASTALAALITKKYPTDTIRVLFSLEAFDVQARRIIRDPTLMELIRKGFLFIEDGSPSYPRLVGSQDFKEAYARGRGVALIRLHFNTIGPRTAFDLPQLQLVVFSAKLAPAGLSPTKPLAAATFVVNTRDAAFDAAVSRRLAIHAVSLFYTPASGLVTFRPNSPAGFEVAELPDLRMRSGS